MGSCVDVLIFCQRVSVVKHLRDFHSEVQAFCGVEAQVAHRAVALEAADAQTPAEVAVVHHVQDGLAVAKGRAQPPDTPVKPPQCGQHAVKRVAEEASHEDCSTKVSRRKEKCSETSDNRHLGTKG